MNIYVFKRSDGSEWADYALPEGAKVIRRIHETRVAGIERIAKEGGRVGALAERTLKEIAVAHTLPEPPVPVARELRQRGFVGRLKWLFTGK